VVYRQEQDRYGIMTGTGKAAANYPWGHHRRFNAYSEYFRKLFGERIQKVSVNAGFTCPNRDGTKGTGGCTFCANEAFSPYYCEAEKSVTVQISEGIAFHEKRYRKVESYLAYFQSYSNTYSSPGRLMELYEEALKHQGIRGIIIGTRPDCIDEEKLGLLRELARTHYVAVEYGIESCYDSTLRRINRAHTFEDAVNAVKMTSAYGISTGAHFIFGFPGESREEMLAEADIISVLPLTTVKFHQLQIIKGTMIEKEYLADPSKFQLFSREEYIDFIVSFLERFNPEIVVERFSGEAPPRFLAVSLWGKKRSDQVSAMIERRLEELDTWQGRLYKKHT